MSILILQAQEHASNFHYSHLLNTSRTLQNALTPWCVTRRSQKKHRDPFSWVELETLHKISPDAFKNITALSIRFEHLSEADEFYNSDAAECLRDYLQSLTLTFVCFNKPEETAFFVDKFRLLEELNFRVEKYHESTLKDFFDEPEKEEPNEDGFWSESAPAKYGPDHEQDGTSPRDSLEFFGLMFSSLLLLPNNNNKNCNNSNTRRNLTTNSRKYLLAISLLDSLVGFLESGYFFEDYEPSIHTSPQFVALVRAVHFNNDSDLLELLAELAKVLFFADGGASLSRLFSCFRTCLWLLPNEGLSLSLLDRLSNLFEFMEEISDSGLLFRSELMNQNKRLIESAVHFVKLFFDNLHRGSAYDQWSIFRERYERSILRPLLETAITLPNKKSMLYHPSDICSIFEIYFEGDEYSFSLQFPWSRSNLYGIRQWGLTLDAEIKSFHRRVWLGFPFELLMRWIDEESKDYTQCSKQTNVVSQLWKCRTFWYKTGNGLRPQESIEENWNQFEELKILTRFFACIKKCGGITDEHSSIRLLLSILDDEEPPKLGDEDDDIDESVKRLFNERRDFFENIQTSFFCKIGSDEIDCSIVDDLIEISAQICVDHLKTRKEIFDDAYFSSRHVITAKSFNIPILNTFEKLLMNVRGRLVEAQVYYVDYNKTKAICVDNIDDALEKYNVVREIRPSPELSATALSAKDYAFKRAKKFREDVDDALTLFEK